MSDDIQHDPDDDDKVEAVPTTVQANLIDKFKGTYEPAKDKTFYRNDGNKHIKSIGVQC